MDWNYTERRRRVRNYRLMFKTALVFCAVGVVFAAFGGLYALLTADPIWLWFGMLLGVFGAGSAWLTVDSTVKIIELDIEEERDGR